MAPAHKNRGAEDTEKKLLSILIGSFLHFVKMRFLSCRKYLLTGRFDAEQIAHLLYSYPQIVCVR